MTSFNLLCNLCKNCGFCCFNCEYLNPDTGCTNDEFRKDSRCTSFPIIFGSPEKMGYGNIESLELQMSQNSDKFWFFFPLNQCLIQQNEIVYNALRWFINDINGLQFFFWFFLQIEDIKLDVFIE